MTKVGGSWIKGAALLLSIIGVILYGFNVVLSEALASHGLTDIADLIIPIANLFAVLLILLTIGKIMITGTGLGFAFVRDNQVGTLVKNFLGAPLPVGQIIARNGEVGVQAELLRPGFYWFLPGKWRVILDRVITIPAGKIGIVKAKDGAPLTGILGRVIGCNDFQDAIEFFNDGADENQRGQKGVQRAILRPGDYRINTSIFDVTLADATVIREGMLGVVTARDGKPLPDKFVIAPEPADEAGGPVDHKLFQDAELFAKYGYMGVQSKTLPPGTYYINTAMFSVEEVEISKVPPGYVGVPISNRGERVSAKHAMERVEGEEDDQVIVSSEEVALTDNIEERGICRYPLTTSHYNINPRAIELVFVPTSAIGIDWMARDKARKADRVIPIDNRGNEFTLSSKPPDETEKTVESYKYEEFTVISKDGFEMRVDAQLIVRILPKDASYIISRFGSIVNLITQVIYPQMNATLYNIAGQKDATDFILKRYEVQADMVNKITKEFEEHRVIVQSLLIGDVEVDKQLLTILRNTMLAKKQQEQFKEQTEANREEIQVKKQFAIGAQQDALQAAIIGVQVAESLAEAKKIQANADGYTKQVIGQGEANAYNAKAAAVGTGNLAAIELTMMLAEAGIPLVPRVAMVGGDGKDSNQMAMNALAAVLGMTLDDKTGSDEEYKFELLPGPKPREEGKVEKGIQSESGVAEAKAEEVIPEIPTALLAEQDEEPKGDLEKKERMGEER